MCARVPVPLSQSLHVVFTGLRERLYTAMAGDGTDQRALQYEQTLVSSQSSCTLREPLTGPLTQVCTRVCMWGVVCLFVCVFVSQIPPAVSIYLDSFVF